MRSILFVFLTALVAVLGVTHAGAEPAEPPFRILSEDVYATQCKLGICATLQVTRSTFSTGTVETILFFSAYDQSGNLIQGYPFVRIESDQFVFKKGHHATVHYLDIAVAFDVTDELKSVSSSTEVVRRKTETGFTRHRLTEERRSLSAGAEGQAGPVVFDVGHIPENEGFSSAFLTTRRVVSRTRVLDGDDE